MHEINQTETPHDKLSLMTICNKFARAGALIFLLGENFIKKMMSLGSRVEK
jgi:hypothetical protein